MFDACVSYDIKKGEMERLNIKVGTARVERVLNFNRKELVFYCPKDSKSLRKAVDTGLPFGIINSELIHTNDSVHYPRAGIDDTIAKIMGRKKIALVFNLNLLLKNKGKKRGLIIRRMMENMRRAVKYDIPVLFASCAKNKYELFNNMMIKTWANKLGIDNYDRVKKSFNKIFK